MSIFRDDFSYSSPSAANEVSREEQIRNAKTLPGRLRSSAASSYAQGVRAYLEGSPTAAEFHFSVAASELSKICCDGATFHNSNCPQIR